MERTKEWFMRKAEAEGDYEIGAGQRDVLLYTKADCPYCKKIKDLLNMLGMGYAEFTVGKHIDSETYKEKVWPTVPCVIVRGKKIGGYEEFAQWTVDNNKFG